MSKSITCPRCARTSYHPMDVNEGYCGNCHAFTHGAVTEVPDPAPDDSEEMLAARAHWRRVFQNAAPLDPHVNPWAAQMVLNGLSSRAEWWRERVGDEAYEKSIEYWREKATGGDTDGH